MKQSHIVGKSKKGKRIEVVVEADSIRKIYEDVFDFDETEQNRLIDKLRILLKNKKQGSV